MFLAGRRQTQSLNPELVDLEHVPVFCFHPSSTSHSTQVVQRAYWINKCIKFKDLSFLCFRYALGMNTEKEIPQQQESPLVKMLACITGTAAPMIGFQLLIDQGKNFQPSRQLLDFQNNVEYQTIVLVGLTVLFLYFAIEFLFRFSPKNSAKKLFMESISISFPLFLLFHDRFWKVIYGIIAIVSHFHH